MSRRNEAAYWGDMLDTARAIEERISTATRRDLDVNVDFRLALMYRLQVIDWERITGLRHLIVHEYWRIDLDRVWDIVTRDIPDLLTALSRILPSDPP
jgi:uncharacterized protein with HEPN domain